MFKVKNFLERCAFGLVLLTTGCMGGLDGYWKTPAVVSHAVDYGNCPQATKAITNQNGIAGVYISNITTVITTNADFTPTAVVQVQVSGGPATMDFSYAYGKLSNITDPFRYELEKGFIDYRSNQTLARAGTRGLQSDDGSGVLQDLVQSNIQVTLVQADSLTNVTQDDIVQAIQTASRQYIDIQLSNQLAAMNKEVSNNRQDMNDYLMVLTNTGSKGPSIIMLNADDLRKRFKNALKASLNNVVLNAGNAKRIMPATKSTSDYTFQNYFMTTAVSGDICVYEDDMFDGNEGSSPADPIIGGHSFLWNASALKLLTSSGNIVEDGKNGCDYFNVGANGGYLMHDNMWHTRVNYPIDPTAFEAQMNRFESRNHLTGYQIQDMDRRITTFGTYCNQVPWLNWWEYTGGQGAETLDSVGITSPLEMNSGNGLNIGAQRSWSWSLCVQVRTVTFWVQILWWGFWMTIPYLDFYWVQVPGPDLVTGTDILNNPGNAVQAMYLKKFGVFY